MARSRSTTPEALVRAAAGVFEAKGYRNATIDDIARAAGVSRPTVYSYTRTKQALLDNLVDAVCDELQARLREALAQPEPPVQRLRRIVDLHVEGAVERRSFYTIVFSEQPELSDVAKARFRQFSSDVAHDFAGLLEECFAERDGGAAPVDPHIAANLLLSMLTSLFRWYDPDGPVSPAALTDQVLELLSGALPAPTRLS